MSISKDLNRLVSLIDEMRYKLGDKVKICVPDEQYKNTWNKLEAEGHKVVKVEYDEDLVKYVFTVEVNK